MNRTPSRGLSRFVFIDACRGLAIVLMIAFHFCFDLAYYGLADFDFYRDPFWLQARTFILSLFVLLVGVGLVLANQPVFRPGHFLRRLGMVAGAALLVSASTWWMFEQRWVFFGVLHFIALASVLGVMFVPYPRHGFILAVILIWIGNLYQFAWFDQPGWRWIGLMTHKPATEDYVPLLPWFGVVLIGIVLGWVWLKLPSTSRLKSSPGGPLMQGLAITGRHSLIIYLLHQPVLMGLLYLVATGS